MILKSMKSYLWEFTAILTNNENKSDQTFYLNQICAVNLISPLNEIQHISRKLCSNLL